MAGSGKKLSSRTLPLWIDVAAVLNLSSVALGEHIKMLANSKEAVYGWLPETAWKKLPEVIKKELSLHWSPLKKGSSCFALKGGHWQPVKTEEPGMHFALSLQEAKAQFLVQESSWQKHLPALEKFLTSLPPGGASFGRKKKNDAQASNINEESANPEVELAQREELPDFDFDTALVALTRHGQSEIEARILIERLRQDNSDELLARVFAKLPAQTPENWWSFLKGKLKMAADEEVRVIEARRRRSSLVI